MSPTEVQVQFSRALPLWWWLDDRIEAQAGQAEECYVDIIWILHFSSLKLDCQQTAWRFVERVNGKTGWVDSSWGHASVSKWKTWVWRTSFQEAEGFYQFWIGGFLKHVWQFSRLIFQMLYTQSTFVFFFLKNFLIPLNRLASHGYWRFYVGMLRILLHYWPEATQLLEIQNYGRALIWRSPSDLRTSKRKTRGQQRLCWGNAWLSVQRGGVKSLRSFSEERSLRVCSSLLDRASWFTECSESAESEAWFGLRHRPLCGTVLGRALEHCVSYSSPWLCWSPCPLLLRIIFAQKTRS